MAEPNAAGPGNQNFRGDNVKDQSWVDVHRSPPLIGQIFFGTDKSELDNNDRTLLATIETTYYAKLLRYADLHKTINFSYNGYTDWRAGATYNYPLAENRANAVSTYVAANLSKYPAYNPASKGIGIDYRGINRPATAKDLQEYRRVDIIADSPDMPQPPRQEAPGELQSLTWKARLIRSVSTGIGVWAADTFQIEIVDLTNNIAMLFKWVGFGLGFSIRGTPGFNADKSSWVNFSTTNKINVMDFEGGGVHFSGQAQISAGGSIDDLKLYGPEAHRGVAPVSLEWAGLTEWGGKGAGIGGMFTGGGISPDPPKQQPYPARE